MRRAKRWLAFLTSFLAVSAIACVAFGAFPTSVLAAEIEVTAARIEETDQGLSLAADFVFDLNPRLAEAVTNGVPLYFVVEFELTRARWYWFDEKAAVKRLQMRLSYHALSRQFRLSTGILQQNHATLGDALSVMRRVRNWLVLDRGAALVDANYEAAVRMHLDVALLPKPFQLSAITSRDLNLESSWKRFSFRPPASFLVPVPAPVESREPKEARDTKDIKDTEVR